MAEDLEAALALAFAPVPPETRHVELQVFCTACGIQVSRFYPVLGIPSEMKLLAEEMVGRACECGVTWTDPSSLAVTVALMEPGEREHAYCLACRQVHPLTGLQPWSTGLRCRGCTTLAEAQNEYETSAGKPWHPAFPVHDLDV